MSDAVRIQLNKQELNHLRQVIKYRLPNMKDSLAAALYLEGELIMTESKARWVPVDLGTLRSSGHVTRPQRTGSRYKVTLGFGGAASAYALVQHERTDFHHKTGSAKYLEGPVKAAASGMGQRLAARMRHAP